MSETRGPPALALGVRTWWPPRRRLGLRLVRNGGCEAARVDSDPYYLSSLIAGAASLCDIRFDTRVASLRIAFNGAR